MKVLVQNSEIFHKGLSQTFLVRQYNSFRGRPSFPPLFQPSPFGCPPLNNYKAESGLSTQNNLLCRLFLACRPLELRVFNEEKL